jgi:hypothetical protein
MEVEYAHQENREHQQRQSHGREQRPFDERQEPQRLVQEHVWNAFEHLKAQLESIEPLTRLRWMGLAPGSPGAISIGA